MVNTTVSPHLGRSDFRSLANPTGSHPGEGRGPAIQPRAGYEMDPGSSPGQHRVLGTLRAQLTLGPGKLPAHKPPAYIPPNGSYCSSQLSSQFSPESEAMSSTFQPSPSRTSEMARVAR